MEEVEREKEKHLRSKRPTEKQFNYDIVLGEDATQVRIQVEQNRIPMSTKIYEERVEGI